MPKYLKFHTVSTDDNRGIRRAHDCGERSFIWGKSSLTKGDTRKKTERCREWVGLGGRVYSEMKAVDPGAKVQKREGTDGSQNAMTGRTQDATKDSKV